MSHLDPDRLALIAIGEPVASPDDLAHLSDCDACATELTEMTRAARIARSTIDDEGLQTPPERLWRNISDELGLSPAAESVSVAPTATRGSKRRARPWRIWALAATLVLIAGGAIGTWAVMARLAPTSIAVATLDAFPAHPRAVGSADVEEARDGSRALNVTLDADEVSDSYREVWLIRNDAGALISLGVLDGDRGSFTIPAGVDLAEYSLVDISVEPVDGDPSHSGDSIVRGALEPT